eukprot:CAMPEP_0185035560 /NCGR_PEP_ID=MMETSP1103-20130426/27177_1 /TAXON_ID=36769 /ORGANISM="Paraphysomonas bandaiensis, Strain Caron Lab Isolate" /LENGTH=67 /DNA_ID=CAMNT_0027572699 /DNA_START=42 /DNA_END=242 /DNA_ORIENTATION=-
MCEKYLSFAESVYEQSNLNFDVEGCRVFRDDDGNLRLVCGAKSEFEPSVNSSMLSALRQVELKTIGG